MEPTPIELIPIVGMVLGIGMIVTIVIVTSRARTQRLQIQAELQAKLIEKFGSTPDLIAFLESKTGRDFVTGVQTGQTRAVRDKAFGGVRLGIMFSAVGLAFLVLWPLTGTSGLVWPGVFLLVLGLAFFASAYSLMRFHAASEPPAQPPALQQ